MRLPRASRLLATACFAALTFTAASAQDVPEGLPEHVPSDPSAGPFGDHSPGPLDVAPLDPKLFGNVDINIAEDGELEEPEEEEPPMTRQERFDALFAELAGIEDDAEAAFVAEEIEALWRDSGSATVDLLTDRATDAMLLGDLPLARDLIDGAIELDPAHAEAWAQSAQIAMVGEEYGLALEHIEQAVILEPRHYHALTELGVILEQLGAPEGAYDAYERALDLNPRLPQAVAGADRTRRAAEGRDL